MNLGQRLNRLFTLNWREKIISIVLAFLFWFMIKAQDGRHTPQMYQMPPPPMVQPSSPAPSKLEPVLPASSAVPSQLDPVLPPPVLPLSPDAESQAAPGIRSATSGTGL